MPTSSASELLIRIGADPSGAETAIAQFRSNFSASLTSVSSDLGQWSTRSSANFSQIDQVAQTLSDHFNVNVGVVNNILDRNRQTAQLWKTELVANLTEVLNTSQNLSVEMERSFTQFDSALGANIANAIIWQKSIGDAFAKAAVQAITSIAEESMVRAIYSAALGFYLLAIQDYSGAAAAFEAAAMYGAVGGGAALAGRALAGMESSTSTSSAAGTSRTTQSSKTASSGSASTSSGGSASQKPVQIIFQGPVYGGQAGIDELVRHITEAVVDRDVNLVAYTVVRQPTPRE